MRYPGARAQDNAPARPAAGFRGPLDDEVSPCRASFLRNSGAFNTFLAAPTNGCQSFHMKQLLCVAFVNSNPGISMNFPCAALGKSLRNTGPYAESGQSMRSGKFAREYCTPAHFRLQRGLRCRPVECGRMLLADAATGGPHGRQEDPSHPRCPALPMPNSSKLCRMREWLPLALDTGTLTSLPQRPDAVGPGGLHCRHSPQQQHQIQLC